MDEYVRLILYQIDCILRGKNLLGVSQYNYRDAILSI